MLDTIKLGEFYNKSQELHNDTQNLTKMYNDNLNKLQYEMNVPNLHPLIRNYRDIIKNSNQFAIKIVEQVTISTGPLDWDTYSVGINKTHWIRLIQRRWREIQKKRLHNMKNLNNLKYREIPSSDQICGRNKNLDCLPETVHEKYDGNFLITRVSKSMIHA